jgi:hypothetical protein
MSHLKVTIKLNIAMLHFTECLALKYCFIGRLNVSLTTELIDIIIENRRL